MRVLQPLDSPSGGRPAFGTIIEAFIALANAVIITRRLIARAWFTHRWGTRPSRTPLTCPRNLQDATYGAVVVVIAAAAAR